MIIIVGLVILIAAVVVGVAGVISNVGAGHSLTHRFDILSYHLGGSSGKLVLLVIVVGGVAIFGLSLLLSGARRTSRLGSAARRGLEQSRDETVVVSRDRDALIAQRSTARAYSTSVPSSGSPSDEHLMGQTETATADRQSA